MKKSILDELASSSEVSWCCIVGIDGFLREISGAPSKYLESVAALAPTLFETSSKSASTYSIGEPARVTIETKIGTLMFSNLGDGEFLALSTQASANLGLARGASEVAVNALMSLK